MQDLMRALHLEQLHELLVKDRLDVALTVTGPSR